MVQLKDMKPGDKGRVIGYQKNSGPYRMRLLALGLTKGTEFEIRSIAPLGDPVEIIVRESRLTLRKAESDALIVEKVSS